MRMLLAHQSKAHEETVVQRCGLCTANFCSVEALREHVMHVCCKKPSLPALRESAHVCTFCSKGVYTQVPRFQPHLNQFLR